MFSCSSIKVCLQTSLLSAGCTWWVPEQYAGCWMPVADVTTLPDVVLPLAVPRHAPAQPLGAVLVRGLVPPPTTTNHRTTTTVWTLHHGMWGVLAGSYVVIIKTDFKLFQYGNRLRVFKFFLTMRELVYRSFRPSPEVSLVILKVIDFLQKGDRLWAWKKMHCVVWCIIFDLYRLRKIFF